MNDQQALLAALRGAGLEPPGGWLQTPQRLSVPPQQQRGLVFRGLSLAARRFGRDDVPDVLTVLHRHPRLFWSWVLFASRLMPNGRLPAAEREKVILRIGWNSRCLYEFGQHVEVGLRVGLSDAEILRVARGPGACEDAHERALLSACDELFAQQRVTDETWAVLAQRYDDKRLIELLMLAGHYIMIAGFLNSAGLRLEPAIAAKLEALCPRVKAGPG